MGGYDPYSSSKGCAELVTAAYRRSFFSEHRNTIASARAGNVIGGGDWSADRIIPDAIKAFESQQPLLIRNPNAIRPWQHVLEPLSGYLVLAQALYENGSAFEGAWNFGPDDKDARSVKEVVNILIQSWKNEASWKQDGSPQPHEAHFLKLNCSKAKQKLHWTPKWSLEETIESIARWNDGYLARANMRDTCMGQIEFFMYAKN
jgi:CDP-glucose 4,6-dehydratase